VKVVTGGVGLFFLLVVEWLLKTTTMSGPCLLLQFGVCVWFGLLSEVAGCHKLVSEKHS
jgi:hypothetical protein